MASGAAYTAHGVDEAHGTHDAHPHPTGWRPESYVTLALITAFIGAIAARTVLALRRGQLIPAPAPAPVVPITPDNHSPLTTQ